MLQICYLKVNSEPDTLYHQFHWIQTTDVCDVSGVKLDLIGGRIGDLLCFLMNAVPGLVPVTSVCWLQGCQMSICNQLVLLRHSGIISEVSPKVDKIAGSYRVYPTHSNHKFVCPYGDSTYSASIHKQHSWGCFPIGLRCIPCRRCNPTCSTEDQYVTLTC